MNLISLSVYSATGTRTDPADKNVYCRASWSRSDIITATAVKLVFLYVLPILYRMMEWNGPTLSSSGIAEG